MTDLPQNTQNIAAAFAFPSVEAYETEKGISTIKQAASSPHLPAFRMRGRMLAEELSSGQRERELHQLFARRIQAALTGNTDPNLALFPGNLIAAPGEDGATVHNRGILFYDQFQFLLNRGCIASDTSRLPGSICFAPVAAGQCAQKGEIDQSWLWHSIERPALKYLPFTHESAECQPADKLNQIVKDVRLLFSQPNIDSLLGYIRSCWAYSNETVLYNAEAMQHCRQWLTRLNRDIDDERLIAALFEIEAYASFRSALSGDSLAGGSFGGNWLEVTAIPLAQIRPTELCQSQRLLDELLNLPARGFAPIIVNEALCVTDGNHRLTASWLWNLLSSHRHLDWHLANHAFQSAVASYVESKQMAPVLRHELLFHLQTFLVNPETRLTLLERLKPVTSAERIVTALPAVLLPEYLSGAVVKEPYDSGLAIRRAEPAIYQILSSSPYAVLPPRASYHFTDRALLPWFSVLGIKEQQRL